MRRESIEARRGAAWILAVPFLLIGTGCDDAGDTIVVDGLDCGLVRDELFEDWSLTFVPEGAVLTNCDVPSFDGTLVDVDNFTTVYPRDSILAFVSPSGASFDVRADGPDLPNELMASVEADSCLAVVQKWESDDGGWIQCFGTFDRNAHAVPALCDSMDLDTDVPPDGFPDVACGLDRSIALQVIVAPVP